MLDDGRWPLGGTGDGGVEMRCGRRSVLGLEGEEGDKRKSHPVAVGRSGNEMKRVTAVSGTAAGPMTVSSADRPMAAAGPMTVSSADRPMTAACPMTVSSAGRPMAAAGPMTVSSADRPMAAAGPMTVSSSDRPMTAAGPMTVSSADRPMTAAGPMTVSSADRPMAAAGPMPVSSADRPMTAAGPMTVSSADRPMAAAGPMTVSSADRPMTAAGPMTVSSADRPMIAAGPMTVSSADRPMTAAGPMTVSSADRPPTTNRPLTAAGSLTVSSNTRPLTITRPLTADRALMADRALTASSADVSVLSPPPSYQRTAGSRTRSIARDASSPDSDVATPPQSKRCRRQPQRPAVVPVTGPTIAGRAVTVAGVAVARPVVSRPDVAADARNGTSDKENRVAVPACDATRRAASCVAASSTPATRRGKLGVGQDTTAGVSRRRLGTGARVSRRAAERGESSTRGRPQLTGRARGGERRRTSSPSSPVEISSDSLPEAASTSGSEVLVDAIAGGIQSRAAGGEEGVKQRGGRPPIDAEWPRFERASTIARQPSDAVTIVDDGDDEDGRCETPPLFSEAMDSGPERDSFMESFVLDAHTDDLLMGLAAAAGATWRPGEEIAGEADSQTALGPRYSDVIVLDDDEDDEDEEMGVTDGRVEEGCPPREQVDSDATLSEDVLALRERRSRNATGRSALVPASRDGERPCRSDDREAAGTLLPPGGGEARNGAAVDDDDDAYGLLLEEDLHVAMNMSETFSCSALGTSRHDDDRGEDDNNDRCNDNDGCNDNAVSGNDNAVCANDKDDHGDDMFSQWGDSISASSLDQLAGGTCQAVIAAVATAAPAAAVEVCDRSRRVSATRLNDQPNGDMRPRCDKSTVGRSEVDSVSRSKVDPVGRLEVDPVAKSEVEPVGRSAVSRSEVDLVARSNVDPVARSVVDPVARSEVDLVARPEVDPVVRPEVNPVARSNVDPVARSEFNPVTRSAVDLDSSDGSGDIPPTPPSITRSTGAGTPSRFVGGVVRSPHAASGAPRVAKGDTAKVRRKLPTGSQQGEQGRGEEGVGERGRGEEGVGERDRGKEGVGERGRGEEGVGERDRGKEGVGERERGKEGEGGVADCTATAFSIIDVAADRRLFDHFIGEWTGKTTYSLCIACDQLPPAPPLDVSHIGARFYKTGTFMF